MIRKIDSNIFSLTILKVTTFSRIRHFSKEISIFAAIFPHKSVGNKELFPHKNVQTQISFPHKSVANMKRFIYNHLKDWKLSSNRKPLIMYGARQVGKTYIIKEFGDNEFENMV